MRLQYLKEELNQDPYNYVNAVERLASTTVHDCKENELLDFDPNLLHETFLLAIQDLQILQEHQVKTCKKLEYACKEEEEKYRLETSNLQGKYRKVFSFFQSLDASFNSVASKFLNLGDQLESINVPRSRTAEAQKLMQCFNEFQSPEPVLTSVFLNNKGLFEAAGIIQKLYILSQELPSAKFEDSIKNIRIVYNELRQSLIEELIGAHKVGDTDRMKKIAMVLTKFESYSQYMEAFIEESQVEIFSGGDIFEQIIHLTQKYFELMKEVGINPEQVMEKFVLNIFLLKLKKHIVNNLSCDKIDTNKYLMNLKELYCGTLKLSSDLNNLKVVTDKSFLIRLIEVIFQKYLDSYITIEVDQLKEKFTSLLQKYYKAKDHRKKQIQYGRFQDLKRDLQAVIGTRTNINIAQIEDYGGETFISDELVINFIQESSQALQRCQLLSKPSELANNTIQLLEVLLNAVIIDHVNYAVELALHTVPIPESKTQADQIYFFDIVRQTVNVVHLLEKHFNDSFLPLIISTPQHIGCLMKKRFLLAELEEKLDFGIDRSLNAIVGWVKVYLQAGHNKTDYKPGNDLNTLPSPACLGVVQYVSKNVSHIKSCLKGRNSECIITELGCRLHRVIYDHIQQFQYNSSEALRVVCDMNEYKKCIKDFNSPLLNTLFDTLHALCNLLVVKSENLDEVCIDDRLALLDKSVLLNFIELRGNRMTLN